MLRVPLPDAMGLDPGGSVTLVAEGEQLNISPYNKDYATFRSVFAKNPPQAAE